MLYNVIMIRLCLCVLQGKSERAWLSRYYKEIDTLFGLTHQQNQALVDDE
jgi:hypothetical protein